MNMAATVAHVVVVSAPLPHPIGLEREQNFDLFLFLF